MTVWLFLNYNDKVFIMKKKKNLILHRKIGLSVPIKESRKGFWAFSHFSEILLLLLVISS